MPTKIVVDNAKAFVDNGKAFNSLKLVSFCQKCNIILELSSKYYPQGNGQVESPNKNLMRVIRKTLADWDSHLRYALWVERISEK